MNNLKQILICSLGISATFFANAREQIQLAAVPSVSPDGTRFAFVWRGDIWTSGIDGGNAHQLTRHPAEEHWPSWSPDGKRIAFASKRDGYWNIYLVPSKGGQPQQLTHHSEGYTPLEWFPDGKSILAKYRRDHDGFDANRLVRVHIDKELGEELLFDASAQHGTISPSGKKILYVREGANLLYRKGYRGTRAAQIWMYDRISKEHKSMLHESYGCYSPLWKSDESGFYYTSEQDGCYNLWEWDFKNSKNKQVTFFKDDSVIVPRIASKKDIIVFRSLFDFYSINLNESKPPKKINLWSSNDNLSQESRRRWYDSVWNNEARQGIDWTDDCLELTFTAGGDLWVMDTVLRKPKLICGDTSSHETEAVFDNKNDTVWFIRDFGDRSEIWNAKRKEPRRHWFDNERFVLKKFSSSRTNKNRLSISPDGQKLSFCEGTGQLMVTPIAKFNPRQILSSTVFPNYEWSPDSNWICVQSKDSNDNWDIWIASINGEQEPYNLSRDPHWDGSPSWSHDGRIIAFLGKRDRSDETDIHYVYLVPDDERHSEHSETKTKAIQKLTLSRVQPKQKNGDTNQASSKPNINKGKSIERVVIDFENLYKRVKRIKYLNSNESGIFWKKDELKLGFSSDLNKIKSLYYISFPYKKDSHKKLTKSIGENPIWKNNSIHWLMDNVPCKTTGDHNEHYKFKSYQTTNRQQYLQLAFKIFWRNLRDFFHDPNAVSDNWNSILGKYVNQISDSTDVNEYYRLLKLMTGELNSSHIYFELSDKIWPRWKPNHGWKSQTIHLGVVIDQNHTGKGIRIAKVIPDGPCYHPESRVYRNEIIKAINGKPITSSNSLTPNLNIHIESLISLEVSDPNNVSRILTIQPITYVKARELIQKSSFEEKERFVEEKSKSRIGYLHVSRMNWDNLEKFETELFSIGYDKEGIIIDVRNNLGGFTADRMLEMLTRPIHSYTIPRSGNKSYPIGYLGKYFWDKPIVVLCNQNTASNGEIFCHAIKQLNRGKLVGVTTSGSVISVYTNEKFLDVGSMSIPFRSWYTIDDGKSMELNGAIPDYVIWPKPGEIPSGIDRQLDKALEVVIKEINNSRN